MGSSVGVYRGDLRLLAFIISELAANLSFCRPSPAGSRRTPVLLVTVIFVQIVVTLVLVAALARRRRSHGGIQPRVQSLA
jgi:hypothetical protein